VREVEVHGPTSGVARRCRELNTAQPVRFVCSANVPATERAPNALKLANPMSVAWHSEPSPRPDESRRPSSELVQETLALTRVLGVVVAGRVLDAPRSAVQHDAQQVGLVTSNAMKRDDVDPYAPTAKVRPPKGRMFAEGIFAERMLVERTLGAAMIGLILLGLFLWIAGEAFVQWSSILAAHGLPQKAASAAAGAVIACALVVLPYLVTRGIKAFTRH
jgi:hypothetical protein